MTINDLKPDEYHPYYQPYVSKVGQGNVLDILKNNSELVSSFLNTIDQGKLGFRYAEGKWTIKEIVLHLIDTERIFAYRALCIARKDKTDLPGFDQDAYVVNSQADTRSIKSLLWEYSTVRSATVSLFESFDNQAWMHSGVSSENRLSVRAIAFIIVGHENHHLEIIKARYL
ncbi:DinB family protein [Gelidibacter salicanalis]|uniref:DinB family protein n=1 Tax=Gelidibacter salicanalis TaxID=291193 RepID=A0A934NIX5_9FLAO|nr:DinB family protein [Gelidibacter salicanalis]MBJ7882691.1 DinB family protein [Gelidibacter salicanalis]